MDRVLELLATESPQSLRAAVKLLTADVLAASQDQTKHKLKTKISSLLKSSGWKRAYGSVLARTALRDWSIVKSHGGSWAVIMLHALDLPDRVCWKPITRTLTELFLNVQGKPDLSRDVVAGSKIGDFAKRLVSTLPFTRCYSAASKLLQNYPTQCRPYINKLLPVLQGTDASCRNAEAIASTCVSEKQSVDVWKSRVADTLTKIESQTAELSNELELAYEIQQLEWYVKISPRIGAKVPSQKILNTVMIMLSSLKPVAVLLSCRFLQNTFPYLGALYIQKFEDLVYKLAECLDLGQKQGVAAIRVIYLLVHGIGWISEKYSLLFARLQKRVIKLLDTHQIPLGADGLADFVQNPQNFAVATLSPGEVKHLVSYLTTVVINVPGIPQSLRVQSDRAILKYGSNHDVVAATLYPAKYSILPLAIDRIPDMVGFQALVHPRFPPLNASKTTLTNLSGPEEEDDNSIQTMETEQVDMPNEKDSPPPLAAADADEAAEPTESPSQTVMEDMPRIPESTKPKRRSEIETPPEKRTKVDQAKAVQIQEPAAAPNVFKETEKEGPASPNGPHNDDDDDELVIPVLNMDSD